MYKKGGYFIVIQLYSNYTFLSQVKYVIEAVFGAKMKIFKSPD